MGALWGSLAGALLPEPQRSAVARRWGGDAAFASLLLGLVQFFAGARLLVDDALAQLHGMAEQIAAGFLAESERRTLGAGEALGFTWSGAMLWLFWLLHPWTWVLISLPVVGLLRLTAFLSTRQPVAEPAVWALVRLTTLGQARAAATKERVEFGTATEPDEVDADGERDLLVFTPRRRREWTELVTIEIAERFYKVTASDVVARAGRRRYRYRLTEAGEHEVIRRYVAYELPKTGIRWAGSRGDGDSVATSLAGRGDLQETTGDILDLTRERRRDEE